MSQSFFYFGRHWSADIDITALRRRLFTLRPPHARYFCYGRHTSHAVISDAERAKIFCTYQWLPPLIGQSHFFGAFSALPPAIRRRHCYAAAAFLVSAIQAFTAVAPAFCFQPQPLSLQPAAATEAASEDDEIAARHLPPFISAAFTRADTTGGFYFFISAADSFVLPPFHRAPFHAAISSSAIEALAAYHFICFFISRSQQPLLYFSMLRRALLFHAAAVRQPS